MSFPKAFLKPRLLTVVVFVLVIGISFLLNALFSDLSYLQITPFHIVFWLPLLLAVGQFSGDARVIFPDTFLFRYIWIGYTIMFLYWYILSGLFVKFVELFINFLKNKSKR